MVLFNSILIYFSDFLNLGLRFLNYFNNKRWNWYKYAKNS